MVDKITLKKSNFHFTSFYILKPLPLDSTLNMNHFGILNDPNCTLSARDMAFGGTGYNCMCIIKSLCGKH